MKKITLTLATILYSAISFVFGQDQYSGTTIEEYNYVTKGFSVQLQSGLDMKKGYRLGDLEESSTSVNFSDASRKVDFKVLYKEGWQIPRALMVIYKKLPDGEPLYYCIPNGYSDEEVWNKCFKDLLAQEGQGNFLFTMVYGLSKVWSFTQAYCFPAGTLITLADGSQKEIENLTLNENILSYNKEKNSIEPTTITSIESHQNNSISISKITLFRTDLLLSSTEITISGIIEILSTETHPFLTSNSIKSAAELNEGDILKYYDAPTKEIIDLRISKVENGFCKTEKVFNIKTDKGTFLANNIVVLVK